MFAKVTISLALLLALSGMSSAKQPHQDTASFVSGAEQRQSSLPSHAAAGKRSKRDSISPDLYKATSEDAEMISGVPPPFPTDLNRPDVTEMLNDPAVMQALYDRAKAEGDGDDFISPYTLSPQLGTHEDDNDDELAEKRGRLFVGKRPRLFVGKRRLFVGKRPRMFVGKRQLFVGKRQRLFVGKRPRLFVGKRQRLFVGKRPRLFVGKRQRLFVGKRDWQSNLQRHLQEFLKQKEQIGDDFPKRFREFVGKRYGYLSDFQADKRPQRMFIGKRNDYAQMLQSVQDMVDKRARLFVGKREHFLNSYPDEENGISDFVDKRQDEVVNGANSIGQGGISNEGFEDNKRSRMFVGKRSDSDPYDLMDKRHRYFVGKRADSLFDNDGDKGRAAHNAASSPKDENLTGLKRAREFVGRRNCILIVTSGSTQKQRDIQRKRNRQAHKDRETETGTPRQRNRDRHTKKYRGQEKEKKDGDFDNNDDDASSSHVDDHYHGYNDDDYGDDNNDGYDDGIFVVVIVGGGSGAYSYDDGGVFVVVVSGSGADDYDGDEDDDEKHNKDTGEEDKKNSFLKTPNLV
ncbi:protein PRQFV-amide precursor [Elysia marginata]|uniref:Protein PRQFV-amide n=1 Tax=Elysia marginata TaxID=1093978 RepID=A0AAV4FZX8_9GAST|nr:protein PRQFV-amide precursor [Elysia marginata]